MTAGTDKAKAQEEGNVIAETQCAGTIPIIPVRYAIVPRKDDNQPQYLYQDASCGSRLEQGFSELKRAVYTLRSLRSGYVYLYDDTKGTLHIWEADGKGNYTEMQYTSLEDYQKPGNLSAGRTLNSIWAFEDSETVYIGFSTNLLTQKMVAKVESDSSFRSHFMHPVNVKELNDWSEQPTTQQHMFGITDLPAVVEEYKATITDFGWSNYTEEEQTAVEKYENLALDYHEKARSKVPAVIALYDNEAMTQDIGNIAAQHIHEIADAKQRVQSGDGGALPDTALLDTGDIATASAALYRKKMVYENLKQTLQGTHNDDADLIQPRYRSTAEKEMLPDEQYNEQADEIMEHVDKNALNQFYADWQDLEEKVAALKPKARDALADHACWLKTAESGHESTPTALASILATYDRSHAHSALWFEMTTALCIDGMGAVIPNDLDHKDERDALLDAWMDDPNSLIYQSIAPFEPFKEEFSVFKDKLDSAGDILGGASTGLENLHKMFPYTRATEITTKAIVSYGMRKLDTSVKWSENFFDTLGKQLSSNKTQVAMQMLGARYNLSKASVQNHSITTKTSQWINQAKRQAPTSSSNIKTRLVNNNGTLTLTEARATTQTTTRMSANLLREIGTTSFGIVVSYFHYLNVSSAISTFNENKSGLNAANMLSALMGVAGAFGETALGLRGIANKTMPTNQIVARAAQNTIFKVLASKAFIRFTGFAGAAAEAYVHVSEGIKLLNKGDTDAAGWSIGAGLSLGVGGIMMTAGIIAGSLPGLGWVLAGVLLIGVGIFCLFEKEDATNTPFQIWLNRSCLGVNDADVGSSYSSTDQEAQGYAVVCYSARKLDELPESMQGKGVSKYAETDWHENYGWEDRVYFLVFLPGYDLNNSAAEVNLYAYDEWSVDEEDYKQATVLNTDTGVTVLSHAYHESGLVLYIDKPLKQSAADSVRLQVDYWPNRTTLNTKVTSNLFLDG